MRNSSPRRGRGGLKTYCQAFSMHFLPKTTAYTYSDWFLPMTGEPVLVHFQFFSLPALHFQPLQAHWSEWKSRTGTHWNETREDITIEASIAFDSSFAMFCPAPTTKAYTPRMWITAWTLQSRPRALSLTWLTLPGPPWTGPIIPQSSHDPRDANSEQSIYFGGGELGRQVSWNSQQHNRGEVTGSQEGRQVTGLASSPQHLGVTLVSKFRGLHLLNLIQTENMGASTSSM